MKFISRAVVAAGVTVVLAFGSTSVAFAASNVTVIKSIPVKGSKTVKVSGGNSVRFEIPSNATTGYHYTVATTTNTADSKVSKPKYVAPDTGMVGSGGTTVVTVIPNHSGTTVVKFTNVAPGGAIASVSSVKLNFMN